MLRKLFGLQPDPSPRRAAPLYPPGVPHRRKPVFEALENRLLLSADPLGVLAGNGVLSLQLGDGNDRAVVERVGESAAGGEIVAVTLGTVTQRFGDQFLGIVRLLIDAGAGDDWLRILGVTAATEIVGGLGTDTFEWQGRDATWSITALDTGQVETVTFSSFEHLAGGDDSRDTFLFAAGATVSGGVDGGAGGLDSLVIQGGEYERITYTASAPGAGTIALDDRTVAFARIEPVTLGAVATALELNAGAGGDVARLRDDAAAGATVLESLAGSLADVAFLNPTVSLTIDLGGGDDRITIETGGGFAAALEVSGGDGRDRIDFDGTVATGGHDLVAAAETIVVAAGSVLRTDAGAGGIAGDLVLAAAGTGTADAAVTITGATLIAGNVVISATTAFGLETAPAAAGVTAAVTIDGGAEVTAAGTLTIGVSALVTTAEATGGTPAVSSTAVARIGGAAALAAGGDIEIDVANRVDLAGASAPEVAVALETAALVEGGATLVAQDIRMHAATDVLDRGEVVALADFASVTRAAIADDVSVSALGAVLVTTASPDLVGHTWYAEAVSGLHPEVAPEPLGRDGGAAVPEDRRFAPAIDPVADPAAGVHDEGFVADPRPAAAAGRPLPEAAEQAVAIAAAVFGAWREDASPAVDGAALLELPPVAGALVAASTIAARADLPAAAPAEETDAGARGSRAPERDDDADDESGLGASLVLSVLKESAFAELARHVSAGGGTVVLAAGGTPFARGRTRGGEAIDTGLAGALELRDGDLGGAVVVDEAGDAPIDAALASAGELVLATAARHDLVGEADGGAERGTAVTAATAIDFSAVEAALAAADGETLTRPASAEGMDAPHAAGAALTPADGIAGLALSLDLPPIALRYLVGDDAREADAIRSADEAGAPVTAGAIAVSGALDPARIPPPAPGREHDVDELVRCLERGVADGGVAGPADDASIGASREVVIAYLGGLAAPIAASAGLTREGDRRGRGEHLRGSAPNGAGRASRAAFGEDAVRAGGAWAERFVNELGLAPEDANPNAKIKLKI